jgi:hypothetical protein
VDKDTTKLAYMRAAMRALANVHGITFAFMKSLGGKEALLREFPTIKEQVQSRWRPPRRSSLNSCGHNGEKNARVVIRQIVKGLVNEMEFEFFDKNEYVLGLNKNLYWLFNYC